MTAPFLDHQPPPERCAECPQTTDLTKLGWRPLCPKHFREAIADLELRKRDHETPNTPDETDHSGIWST